MSVRHSILNFSGFFSMTSLTRHKKKNQSLTTGPFCSETIKLIKIISFTVNQTSSEIEVETMPDLSLTFMRLTPKGYKIEHSCFFYSTVDVVLLEKTHLRLWSRIKKYS